MPKKYLEPQPCACGCGTMIIPKWRSERQTYTRFVEGHYRKLTEFEELEAVRLYEEESWTKTAIAEKFHMSNSNMGDVLKRRGVVSRLHGEKRFSNQTYFDNLDSPEKAYWLGFLAADGSVTCIEKKRYCLQLVLKAEDCAHVKLLRNALQSNALLTERVVKGKSYFGIDIHGKHLVKQVVSLGIEPRKSWALEYPSISPELDKAFMLGYFDGDGSISRSSCINQLQFSVLGTEKFLKEYGQRLLKPCYLKKVLMYPAKKNSSTWQLCYCGNRQVPRIMNWLYKDAIIYLPRKRQRYLELVGNRIQLTLTF